MPYCKYCGAKVDTDAIFCSACGKNLIHKERKQAIGDRELTDASQMTEEYRIALIKELLRSISEAELAEMDQRIMAYNMAVALLELLIKMAGERHGKETYKRVENALAKRFKLRAKSLFRV